MTLSREKGLGIVGTLKSGEGGRSLILNGHIPTVAPGEEGNWSHPQRVGAVENGRGGSPI